MPSDKGRVAKRVGIDRGEARGARARKRDGKKEREEPDEDPARTHKSENAKHRATKGRWMSGRVEGREGGRRSGGARKVRSAGVSDDHGLLAVSLIRLRTVRAVT